MVWRGVLKFFLILVPTWSGCTGEITPKSRSPLKFTLTEVRKESVIGNEFYLVFEITLRMTNRSECMVLVRPSISPTEPDALSVDGMELNDTISPQQVWFYVISDQGNIYRGAVHWLTNAPPIEFWQSWPHTILPPLATVRIRGRFMVPKNQTGLRLRLVVSQGQFRAPSLPGPSYEELKSFQELESFRLDSALSEEVSRTLPPPDERNLPARIETESATYWVYGWETNRTITFRSRPGNTGFECHAPAGVLYVCLRVRVKNKGGYRGVDPRDFLGRVVLIDEGFVCQPAAAEIVRSSNAWSLASTYRWCTFTDNYAPAVPFSSVEPGQEVEGCVFWWSLAGRHLKLIVYTDLAARRGVLYDLGTVPEDW